MPRSAKSWVHKHPSFDSLSRKLFAGMVGRDAVTIPSGPMAGVKLIPGLHVSHAHLRGVYELATLEALDRLVPPGSICYDLGASIGYLSLLMARKAKHVYAFEPAPHAAEEIRKQAIANGMENITVVTEPVSNNQRDVHFAVTDVAYGSSISGPQSRWPELQLRTTTLDVFAKHHPLPDFIKIDVEGEEVRVLEGASRILELKRPILCCELHSTELAREVQIILTRLRYAIFSLTGEPFQLKEGIVGGETQVICRPLA
jgi:FkbM family methyltransferase